VTGDALTTERGFVARRIGVRSGAIAPESRLVEDLRIDGDDLVDLMDALFAEFRITPGGYAAADYASPEGFSLFGKRGRDRRPLPVSMLVEAVGHGRWPG
jgi:acyl carrier protein